MEYTKLNSINHHYIPQLYLKGFTASNGKLQVFDKSLNNFKKDKQTPKTVFFIKHKNTIKFNGILTDKIEKIYNNLESPFGDLFDLIKKGITNNELIFKEGIYLLKLFIAIQFFRMPLLDDFAENFIKNIDLSKFGERITIGGIPIGNIENIRKLIETDKGFRHFFRCFVLPILMFDIRVHEHDYKSWKIHTVSDEFSHWDNILIGDKPFIVENIADIFAFNTKLIFPLSKTQIVTYTPNSSKSTDLPAIFSTKLSMLMYAQSQRYLAGANRDYMQQIITLYKEVYGNDGNAELQKELFEYL